MMASATMSTCTSQTGSRVARLLRYLEIPLLVAVPVVLMLAVIFEVDQAALLTMLVALVAVGVFVAGFETSHPALRQIMPTVVLSAVAVAGRILFFAIPAFKPVSAICIVAGAAFGRRCGFMTGALAALVSNFFFGQGMWTPWQMYGLGLIGYFAGVLSDRGLFDYTDQQGHAQIRRLVLYIYAFIATMLYGVMLDTWTYVGFIRPLTWESALLTYAAGFPYNIVHAGATMIFLLIIYEPWRKKLRRIKNKYYFADKDTANEYIANDYVANNYIADKDISHEYVADKDISDKDIANTLSENMPQTKMLPTDMSRTEMSRTDMSRTEM